MDKNLILATSYGFKLNSNLKKIEIGIDLCTQSV